MHHATLRQRALFCITGFRFTSIALCCAFLLLLTGGAQAQTIIDWTAGGTDDRYNNAFNWTGLNVPNTTSESARFNLVGSYDVTFGSGVTTTVSDLIVQAGGINFAANAVVPTFYNVDDDLIVNGGVLILSDDGGVGDVVMNVADDVRVEAGSLLRIDGGSDLNTDDLKLANSSNGGGFIIVDGAGSQFNKTGVGIVNIGQDGDGTLTYSNGATSSFSSVLQLSSFAGAGNSASLIILSGASVTASTLQVAPGGTNSTASGDVFLSGSMSALEVTTTFTVGDNAAGGPSGLVDVLTGSTLTAQGTTTVYASGELNVSDGTFNANGDVTIDGGTLTRTTAGSLNLAAGKKLTASNGAQVTLTGAYFLNQGTEFEINSGADLFFSAIGVGFFGSDGTLVADGLGSTVTTLAGSTSGIGIDGATAEVTFRNQATGTLAEIRLSNTNDADPNTTGILNIESGAAVTMDDLYVTNVGGVGASGTVTVTGAGSTLTQNGTSLLTLGHASTGAATINIENGGTFTTGTGTTTINATGTLTVTDGTFNANGALTMTAGTTLTLDGGSLNAAAGFDNSAEGTFDFRDGTLTVTGGAFAPNAGGPTDDYVIDGPTAAEMPHLVLSAGATANVGRDLFVGDTNRGELTITGGATISNDTATIGDGPNSTGTVTVDGTGSNWTNTGTLVVGSIGNGTLNIQNGADVSSNLGPIATLTASSTGTVTVDGAGSTWTSSRVDVGRIGNGTLNILSGGAVSGDFGLIGSNSFSTGTATVDGAGSAWTSSVRQSVGAFGNGTLNILNGGTVSNLFGHIGRELGSTGTAAVDGAGSTWTNSDSLIVGGDGAAAGGTANLTVQGGGLVEVDGTLKIWNTGTVTLDGGSIVVDTFDHTDGGTFNFIDGTLAVATFLGDLSQDGGTIAPGDSPGLTAITGDYTINAGALEIELFGNGGGSPLPGVDFDQLTADTANLAGTLDLVIDPNYSPTLGDLFPIISTTSGVSGTFGAVSGADIGSGLMLGVLYSANDVTVGVVLAGDFDFDFDVDGADFLKWQRGESPDPLSQSDLVDWQSNYGMVAPLSATSTAVPEPTTWVGLLFGMLALPFRRGAIGS